MKRVTSESLAEAVPATEFVNSPATMFANSRWYAGTRAYIPVDSARKWICWRIGCLRGKCGRNTEHNRQIAREKKIKVNKKPKGECRSQELMFKRQKNKEAGLKWRERSSKFKAKKRSGGSTERDAKQKLQKSVVERDSKRMRQLPPGYRRKRMEHKLKKDRMLEAARQKAVPHERSRKAKALRRDHLARNVARREEAKQKATSKATQSKAVCIMASRFLHRLKTLTSARMSSMRFTTVFLALMKQ